MAQEDPKQEELIPATVAMRELKMRSTEFYRMIKREGIERVVHPRLVNKGMYKKADIERLKKEFEEFDQKYKVVG